MRTSTLFLLCGGLFLAQAGAVTLDELAADPQLWPAEVSVTATTKAGVVKDGRVAGMMLIGAGRKLVVTGVTAEGVTGKMGGVTVLVAADKTDLLSPGGQVRPAPAPVMQPAAAAPSAMAAEPAAARAVPGGRPSVMQRRLAGKLVRLEGGTLKAYDAAQLAGVKYYGLYYSASWCGPCRQFTPQFIQYYRQLKQQYPEFEVVFVSADRSAGDMRSYMRDDAMPWLALKYDDAQQESELRRYCGPGIPCLVLVDPQGRVLSDSFEGDNYVGPGKVLRDATRLLAQGR
jgi:nucleoredoxin